MIVPPDTFPPVEAEPAPRRRPGLVAFVVAAAVVLVVVGAVGVLAVLRALDFGDRMASAEAMPPDTQLYVDIDFGSLDDLDRLLMAFDDAFAQGDLEPGLDTVVDLIDEGLREEFGIGVDDVTPWVGRDVGIGVADIRLDPSGPPDARLIAAISVRDGSGADAFVDQVVGILAERDGMTFTESTYEGVRILSSDVDIDGQQLVVGRSGDLLLLGNSDAAVRRAIDAQSGASLADDAVMEETLDGLPTDRALTLYAGPTLFEDLADEMDGLLPGAVAPIPTLEFEAVALSAALTDEGVQVDLVTRRDPADQGLAAAATAPGSSELPGLLPQGTFIYVGIAGDEPLLGADATLDGMLAESGLGEAELQEVQAALDEMEGMLGFDIDDDLLRHLGGDFGFGIFPADEPVGTDPGGAQVGFLGLAGVTDPVVVADTAARFRAFLADQGIPFAERQAAGATLYAIGEGPNDLVMFGVVDDYLVIASDHRDVAAMFDVGSKLADDPLFQEAAAALPQRGDPIMFVDLRRAMAELGAEPDLQDAWAPIAGFAANADETDTTSRFTFLALIDY